MKCRKTLLPIVVFAMVLFLATSMEAAYANEAINKEILPDFLLRLSEYLSKGNATELARIRNQMIQQEKIKQDRIRSTNGAVLHFSPMDYQYINYLNSISFHSEPTIDPLTHEVIGHIDDWDYLVGAPGGVGALLETTGWYEYPPGHFVGGEAFAGGPLDQGVYDYSDVYVVAKVGPLSGERPPWYNYLIIWYSTDGYNYDYLSYVEVHNYDWEVIYIGSTWYLEYSYVAVSSWCPPNWNPPEKSSVLVDNVDIVIWDW